jgi:hypothetical protein
MAKLNDGTTGHRYSWGLWRKRKALRLPFSVVKGPQMTGVHLGLCSVYVNNKGGRRGRKRLSRFGG